MGEFRAGYGEVRRIVRVSGHSGKGSRAGFGKLHKVLDRVPWQVLDKAEEVADTFPGMVLKEGYEGRFSVGSRERKVPVLDEVAYRTAQ